jgi:hypothetical protein
MWWTTFTALTPSLFYFSVWQLGQSILFIELQSRILTICKSGITGSELALFALLSPYILSYPSMKRYWESKEGRNIVAAFEFIGAIAWLSPLPSLRLIMVTLAAASANVRLTIDWASTENGTENGVLLVVGLLLHSLSKLANNSNNPCAFLGLHCDKRLNNKTCSLAHRQTWVWRMEQDRDPSVTSSFVRDLQATATACTPCCF